MKTHICKHKKRVWGGKADCKTCAVRADIHGRELLDAANLLMARLKEFGDIDRIRDEAPLEDLKNAIAKAEGK